MHNPLSEVSFILNLKIRKWAGEVSDKKALNAVALAFNGDTSKDRYRKSLFVNDPLSGIDKCAGRIRLNYYRWTLAWLDSGNGRLVSSMDYRDFAIAHRALVSDFEQAADLFVAEYPEHCALAKERKGDLYREEEYPTQAALRDRFEIELTTLPFPSTTDFRVQAPQEIIEELRRGMDDSIMAVASTVEEDIRIRTQERLQLLCDGITSGKRWSRTLFEELQFIVDMGCNMQKVLSAKLFNTLMNIRTGILIFDPKKLRHSEEQMQLCRQLSVLALAELQS